MVLTLAIALGCGAGCGSSANVARDVTILTEPPYSEPIVVLTELQEVSGAVDSGAPPRMRMEHCSLRTYPADALALRTFGTTQGGFFWFYRYEVQRWTLFSPGHAAVTIYPQEGGTDLDGQHWLYACIGDSSTSLSAPQPAPGPPLGERYASDSKEVTLRLPSSDFPIVPPITGPLSLGQQNSLPHALGHLSPFGEQVRALRRALETCGEKDL